MNMSEVVEIGNFVINLPADHPGHFVDQAGGLFPPSRYYLAFRMFAEKFRPKTMVVLGVCGGGDCYHLAIGNPEGKVVGVDIAYDHPEQLEYIKKTCPNFEFWMGDSVGSAKAVFEKVGPIEFLFIDTTHTLEATCWEFEAWKPYLADGALVCFDDLFRTEMGNVWDLLPGPKTRLDLLHDGSPDVGGGFGVLLHSMPAAEQTVIPPVGYELGN